MLHSKQPDKKIQPLKSRGGSMTSTAEASTKGFVQKDRLPFSDVLIVNQTHEA
jgi:hypothetical protein